jgi:hypothetical protein
MVWTSSHAQVPIAPRALHSPSSARASRVAETIGVIGFSGIVVQQRDFDLVYGPRVHCRCEPIRPRTGEGESSERRTTARQSCRATDRVINSLHRRTIRRTVKRIILPISHSNIYGHAPEPVIGHSAFQFLLHRETHSSEPVSSF